MTTLILHTKFTHKIKKFTFFFLARKENSELNLRLRVERSIFFFLMAYFTLLEHKKFDNFTPVVNLSGLFYFHVNMLIICIFFKKSKIGEVFLKILSKQ